MSRGNFNSFRPTYGNKKCLISRRVLGIYIYPAFGEAGSIPRHDFSPYILLVFIIPFRNQKERGFLLALSYFLFNKNVVMFVLTESSKVAIYLMKLSIFVVKLSDLV